MNAKQIDIARKVGLDVSSVNKILSGSKRWNFKPETIAQVLRVAKKLGYDFDKPTKGKLVALLVELFPGDAKNERLADERGISIEKVEQIKRLIARAGGAAIVLLILRGIFIGI